MNIGASGSSTSSITPQSNNKGNNTIANAGVSSSNTTQLDQSALRIAINHGEKVSIGEKQLIQAIDRALKAMQGPTTILDVSIHEKTHAIMVKVLDKDTGEIIREVPPEKTLDIVAKMMEIAGLLVDERV